MREQSQKAVPYRELHRLISPESDQSPHLATVYFLVFLINTVSWEKGGYPLL